MATEISVGIRTVDEQHDDLVAQVSQLMESARSVASGESFAPALDRLQQSVVSHFQCEEDFMLKHRFPGYERHKARHDAFVQSFLGLKSDLLARGGSEAVAERIERELGGWLVSHIQGFDTRMGEFLVSMGES
jgi:hemerythrin